MARNCTIDDFENVDRQLFYTAATTVGVSRLADLLIVFEVRIAWLSAALVALPSDQPGILATLHQSRGSAATLGFANLERVLANIESQLNQDQYNAALSQTEGAAPEVGAPFLSSQAVEAVGKTWRASLTAAMLIVPELRHYRPCGIKR